MTTDQKLQYLESLLEYRAQNLEQKLIPFDSNTEATIAKLHEQLNDEIGEDTQLWISREKLKSYLMNGITPTLHISRDDYTGTVRLAMGAELLKDVVSCLTAMRSMIGAETYLHNKATQLIEKLSPQ